VSSPVQDLLVEYALGNLDVSDRQRVEDELARSPELAAELASIEETFASVALSVQPIQPSPSARAKLLDAAAQDRFAPFVDRLSALFELTKEKMRAVLALADRESAWEVGFVPGLMLIHFQAGPRWAGGDTGLVRLPPGYTFPLHRHTGDEHVFVLEGSFKDLQTGEIHRPGDLIFRPAGSEHSFLVLEGQTLLFAVALVKFIEILA
jgi:anti-sigma factor ChrR (cupin superfamily)